MLRTIVAVVFFLILGGPGQVGEASAAPVTYRYSGSCFSGSPPADCSFFNLSDGDLVSGSITLDDARLSSTEFASFFPTEPDLQFSFTFGSLSFGKDDLDPNDLVRVMLSDSSGLGIVFQNAVTACVNAVFPCHVVQDGTETLSIGTSFGFVDRYVGPNTQTAYTTNGTWTIATPVPEPATSVLLALGLAGLASKRRWSKRQMTRGNASHPIKMRDRAARR